ncbi:hypothetical protein [Saccharophagus sp. K07]|uniref:hypothetical protein n=1 Tax=Saccharophagus sp. K07 TaxID=2283636 RepID=UPI001652AA54|nr:hypothetical protein [Saccharophagus sp. K07]
MDALIAFAVVMPLGAGLSGQTTLMQSKPCARVTSSTALQIRQRLTNLLFPAATIAQYLILIAKVVGRLTNLFKQRQV